MTEIRPASAGDEPALARLLSEVWRYYTGAPRSMGASRAIADELITGAYTETLIAHDGDNPLGFAVFSFLLPAGERGAALFLKELFVSERARGSGLGKQFMAELVRIAQKRKCSRIDWTTDRENAAARAFYRNIGAMERDDKVFFRLDRDGFEMILDHLTKG